MLTLRRPPFHPRALASFLFVILTSANVVMSQQGNRIGAGTIQHHAPPNANANANTNTFPSMGFPGGPNSPGHPGYPGNHPSWGRPDGYPGHGNNPGGYPANGYPVVVPNVGLYQALPDPNYLYQSNRQSRASFTYMDMGGFMPNPNGLTYPTVDSPSDMNMSLSAASLATMVEAFRQGDYRVASRGVAHALVDNPQSGELLLLAAWCDFAGGKFAASATNLSRGLERVAPEQWDQVYQVLRGYYSGDEEYNSHLRRLDAYVRQHGQSMAARELLGYHQLFSGDRSGAEATISEAIKNDPQSSLAKNLYFALQAPNIEGKVDAGESNVTPQNESDIETLPRPEAE